MQLKAYITMLWRRKWIVAIVTAITLLVTIVGTLLLAPQYEATATLYVATSLDGTYNSGQTNYADRLKKTYAIIVGSDSYLDEVQRRLALEAEPEVNVDVMPNTELMAITAVYRHPQRTAEVANTLAEMIAEESKRTAQGRANPVEVQELASIPRYPVRPNGMLNIVLGLFVGLIGGVGLSLLVESLDTTLYTAEQIEAATDLSVLGKVPDTSQQRRLAFFRESPSGSEEEEAYRRIRTNILAAHYSVSPQTILVTSALPGEGKSTVVSRLGAVMAQSGKRVVIVDSDLRRPTLHEIFALPNEVGLSSVLRKETDLAGAIQATADSPVHVLTSGPLPTHPSEALSSRQMNVLLREMEQRYDVVLLDTPALTAVSDAAVLAPLVGTILLVVRQARVRQETIEATQRQLATVNTKPLGVIINRTERNWNYGYYAESGVKVIQQDDSL